MKNIIAAMFIVSSIAAHAQWAGQTSSSDLVSPINRTGMIYIDTYNSAQIRLNSIGAYYGKIGNPSNQVWSLGWGGQTNDINPALSWTASGNVGIGTTTPTAKLEVNQIGGGSGQNVALKTWAGNNSDYFGNSQIQFTYGGGGGYNHAIKSRHNSAASAGNAIDFYLWHPGDPVNGEGSLSTLTLNGGNVGIGTTTPSEKLEVNGRLLSRMVNGGGWDIALGAADGGGLLIGPVNGNTNSSTDRAHILYRNASGGIYWGYNNTGTTTTQINSQNNGNTYFNSGGNVGIGTSSPDAKLTVSGQIHAQEVKVTVSAPGPDYVFNKDYQLTSLEEIKNYIDQNKHLPEVPSAKEMEKNGIQLGEMNMLLLKKIEELTLYVIEQNRKMEEQNKRIEIQNKEIEQLKNKTK